MKPPRMPCADQGPRSRPRARHGPGVAARAVKGERLCEETKRTEGSLARCTWRTPGAARAAG